MSEMVYCRGCGKQIHKTAPTCPSCGALQVTGLNESGALRTQTAAGLWCIFLGQFGAHWFYLRRTVPGILSLLFFWTWIPAIIAFVNGWQITFGDRQAWAKKYNNGISTPPAHWVVKVLVIAFPVIMIIGILAAILIPMAQESKNRKDTKTPEVIQSVQPPTVAPQQSSPPVTAPRGSSVGGVATSSPDEVVKDVAERCYVYWNDLEFKLGATVGDSYIRARFEMYNTYNKRVERLIAIPRATSDKLNGIDGLGEFVKSHSHQIDALCLEK